MNKSRHTRRAPPAKRRRSKANYRVVADNTYDWEYWLGDSGQLLYVSPSSTRITGYAPAEFQQDPKLLSQIVHPDDRARFAEHLKLGPRPNREELEFRIVHRDGDLRWIGHVCQPVFDAKGRFLGRRASNRDITQRKRAEEALREARTALEGRVEKRTQELHRSNQALSDSEAKYRGLFASLTDPFMAFDAETRQFVEVNDAALQLYGYSRAEFLRLKHTAITAEPEDSEATIALAVTGATIRIPLRYHRRKDGTIFPADISANSFILRGRRVICGILRDITARKQAEEALRKSEQELADFFAEAPLGLLWVGPDGRVLRVNRAQLELLGAAAEHVLGAEVLKFFVDQPATANLLKRLARGETVHNQRARLRPASGLPTHVLVDANGLWENGGLIHSRWFVRDISWRVEMEREMLTIREREQRRLGQDLHDDLCQQLAGMEFLSQRLAGDLAAGGSVEPAQAKEIARMAQRAMAQTRELARGLNPVYLEAEGLMGALRELAMRTKKIFRRDCRFQCETPVLVPDHTMATHLYRIAQEAVGNAVRHGQARRIAIRLKADRGGLLLSVHDNGLGLPKEPGTLKGMGLRDMQYRAGVIGGSLLVQPGPRGGTTVTCRVQDGLPTREAEDLK